MEKFQEVHIKVKNNKKNLSIQKPRQNNSSSKTKVVHNFLIQPSRYTNILSNLFD